MKLEDAIKLKEEVEEACSTMHVIYAEIKSSIEKGEESAILNWDDGDDRQFVPSDRQLEILRKDGFTVDDSTYSTQVTISGW